MADHPAYDQAMAEKRPSTSDGERVFLGWRGLYASVGDHIVHFYLDRAERMEVLVPFLKRGLDEGDKCVLLANPDPGWSDVRSALEAAGSDVKGALDSAQLVVSSGADSAEALQTVLSEAIADTRRRFHLLRWVGDMTWAKGKITTTEELMTFEASCNVMEKPPGVFLCLYDLRIFSGSVLFDSLKTHPLCVIRDSIHQNPFCEDPDVYLEQLKGRQRTASEVL